MSKKPSKATSQILTTPAIMETLHKIFQLEMAGVVRYLHYSFMIMGYHRIPIQKWFRDQANESMAHTTVIGEKSTALGGHPPMITEGIEESNVHAVHQILKETLDFEEETLRLYKKLADQATKEGDVALEELAREFVRAETEHCEEVRKMLHKPE